MKVDFFHNSRVPKVVPALALRTCQMAVEHSRSGSCIWPSVIAVYLLVFTCSTCLAQTSRPFRMSATAVQAYPGEPSLYQNYSATFPFSGLSRDVDVITLFPEFLGIPFDVFAQSATPPETDAWTIQMNALANAANSMGKPLMVEIVLTRQFPVTRAVSA